MNPDEEPRRSQLNNQSITSLLLGVLTFITFCIGWLPFPFTGLICFPASLLLGILALIFGLISLGRIRRHNESGRPLAWTGIIVGGFVILCMLCMVIALASFLMIAPDSIPLPPFLDKYQI